VSEEVEAAALARPPVQSISPESWNRFRDEDMHKIGKLKPMERIAPCLSFVRDATAPMRRR
jgi:hypothetical protein